MPKHREVRTLPYTAQQMFDLVIDVERYADFLPWCQSCRIITRSDDSFVADLAIGYKGISQSFRSRITFVTPLEINVDYLEGRLKYLKNTWQFKDMAPHHCQIDFFIDFSLGGGLLQFAMAAVFEKALFQMIHSFEHRAHQVYGKDIYIKK